MGVGGTCTRWLRAAWGVVRAWPCAGLAGFLLLGAWLPLPAAAQSLQVLLGAARSYDASFLAARLQVDAVQARLGQALASRKPSVNASWGGSASHARTPWNTLTTSTQLQHSAALNAQYTVFNRERDRNIDQAERALEVARAQLQASEQDLVMRVTQAYFDVLAASDALATVRVGKRAIEEQVAAAKKNFEVGTVTITDTREAEARLDLARAQELAAENELQTAQLALDEAVGHRNRRPWPLADARGLPTLAPDDAEAWVRLADDHNPQLKQLRLGVSIGQLEIEKARAARLPTVALTASLQLAQARVDGQSQASDGSQVPYGPRSGAGPAASVGVQVSMPLYEGGSIGERVRETDALAQKSAAELEHARRVVAQAIRTAYYGLRSIMARVEALKAAEASSALALEATQLGYEVGVRVNLDVLNARTQLDQARRDLARARYDVLVNWLKLKQTAGVLAMPDVALVSRLLAEPGR